MSQPAIKFLSENEYLSFERESQEKHEFYKGEIYLMSGASFNHNLIENNVRGNLFNYLKGKKCSSFGSNLRVHIPANSLYTYPDILIVCDKPKFLDNTFDTLLNPAVIIEILSPSTGDYDRGTKFDLYREIETLNEYILLDSAFPHFIHYSKNEDHTWTLSEKKLLTDPFFINTIQFQIPLSEVYAGTE